MIDPDDPSDHSQAIGFLSVLPAARHAAVPAVTSLLQYATAQCPAEHRPTLDAALAAGVGLMISERVINAPPQVCARSAPACATVFLSFGLRDPYT